MPSRYTHASRTFESHHYHDVIRHDGEAVELAELTDGELGPPLIVILYATDTDLPTDMAELSDGTVPLPVLAAFLGEAEKSRPR